MRGVGVAKNTEKFGTSLLRYKLMKIFNQPYSELKKIPYRDVLFFINYENAIQDYIEQERDKQRKK